MTEKFPTCTWILNTSTVSSRVSTYVEADSSGKKVPHTIAMDFAGALRPGVSAKDMMLFLIGKFGLDGGQYQAVEYRGPAIRALPMQERMTLCNMTAELGGQTGLIASDAVTQD